MFLARTIGRGVLGLATLGNPRENARESIFKTFFELNKLNQLDQLTFSRAPGTGLVQAKCAPRKTRENRLLELFQTFEPLKHLECMECMECLQLMEFTAIILVRDLFEAKTLGKPRGNVRESHFKTFKVN